MVYTMIINVASGCRTNSTHKWNGAAASIILGKFGGQIIWQRELPDIPEPTIQAADLTAIILALEQAQEKYSEMTNAHTPWMYIKVHTNSRYACNCMTVWRERWTANDFTTSMGRLVVNRDLLRQAYALQDELEGASRVRGRVDFILIPREENSAAEAEVKERLDKMMYADPQAETSAAGETSSETQTAADTTVEGGTVGDLIEL